MRLTTLKTQTSERDRPDHYAGWAQAVATTKMFIEPSK
jgi:hypothetical protein